jgi:hypothetical protein
MRFQVPQFIDVEDKIFGPLTFKQFIYIVGAGGICVVLFSFLPKFLAIVFSVPVALFGAALAFFKVNDRPFTLIIEDFVKFNIGSKLYIWKRTEPKKSSAEPTQMPIEQLHVPTVSGHRLRDLTFELDVKRQNNPVTEETQNKL